MDLRPPKTEEGIQRFLIRDVMILGNGDEAGRLMVRKMSHHFYQGNILIRLLNRELRRIQGKMWLDNSGAAEDGKEGT